MRVKPEKRPEKKPIGRADRVREEVEGGEKLYECLWCCALLEDLWRAMETRRV